MDCDGVLSDFVDEVLNWINGPESPLPPTRYFLRSEITDFNIFKAWGVPELWPLFNVWIAERHRVLGMAQEEGATEFVAKLRELGEVAVCTSPYKGAPYWIPERIEWLERHFGFKPDDICVWSRKHWVQADILIDDALHNAISFPGRVMLLDAPWNQGALPAHVTRCFGLGGVLSAVNQLGNVH